MYVADVCHKNNYVDRCYVIVADKIATVADLCHLILLVIVVGHGRGNNHCGRCEGHLCLSPDGRCYAIVWQMEWPQLHNSK